MFAFTRWLPPVGLVVLAWLIAAQPAAAQKNKPDPLGGVEDSAGLFSQSAVDRARREIQDVKRETGKDLVIETFKEPPARYAGKEGKEFAREWAETNFDKHRVDGVYVLICKPAPPGLQKGILQVTVGKVTNRVGSFTIDERNQLVKRMLGKLGEASKAADAKDAKKAQELRDEALLSGVSYVRGHMTAPPRAAAKGGAAAPARPANGNPGGLSILHWILIGLAVLLVLWLVIGIIRALAGGGGGGAPGYGYGGGGGGGGFFSSLMGGLFGAAAGMWLYHNFFGGGTPSAGASGGDYGNDGGPSDVGSGGDAAGGDYGGGDAGGDAGGGDWGGGGGGDAGGGGDWGGGGDAGGGGGDFGGGGDWGGGGGDFGGGGGGDW